MHISNPTLMRCLYRVHQAKIHLRSAGAWFQGYARYLRPGTRAYRRHVDEELKHYREVHSDDDHSAAVARENLFEPAPAAWDEVHELAKALIREETGNDLDGHVISRLQSRPNVRLLSLGSGPGGVELGFARQAPKSDIVCMDLNADLLRLGEECARAEHLRVSFEPADLNTVTLPPNEFDIVFCHASLHHLVELESIIEQIKRTLRPGGELFVVDVITRHGYRMWPETRKVVADLWRTLPERYRVNHTAYLSKTVDKRIYEADTRPCGMECIRSEDILPLLSSNFSTDAFVPYFSISRRFFDTMYGPNYDLSRPLDRAIVHWIWELDCEYLRANTLRPETFLGIYKLPA